MKTNYLHSSVVVLSLCLSTLTVRPQLQANQTGKVLDKNYVEAAIYTTNDKFWNLYGNLEKAYEVPVGSGKHTFYANSLWIGGIDDGGLLRVAANTYKQSGTDFWPGPLDTMDINAFSASNSTPYNKLWKVDCDDISNFINAYNSGSVTNNTYQIPADILDYPANGTGNFQRKLCPFVDVNNNGIYNPQMEGDYPLIKGNQQVLSIFNDANDMHTQSVSQEAMGVEIHERSYVYYNPTVADTMQAINYTTYFHYTIINRSTNNYNNVYISGYSDAHMGSFNNNIIGTDSVNKFVYCYSGVATDANGYGNHLPMMSHTLIKTNCSSDGVDNDNDGTIDEPGEQFELNRSTYFNVNQPQYPVATTFPSTNPFDYYNYMSGVWKDGSPFTYGGSAYGGSVPTSYVYTGDPVTNSGWTGTSAGIPLGNPRILFSSGPFTFPAGAKIEWGFALVFSQDTSTVGNVISQFNSRVKRDVKNARYYDEMNGGMLCGTAITVGMKDNSLKSPEAIIYPNPASGLITINLSENVKSSSIYLRDVLGKTVMQDEIKDGSRYQLNISSLEQGIYLMEINTNKGKVTKKIIKN